MNYISIPKVFQIKKSIATKAFEWRLRQWSRSQFWVRHCTERCKSNVRVKFLTIPIRGRFAIKTYFGYCNVNSNY